MRSPFSTIRAAFSLLSIAAAQTILDLSTVSWTVSDPGNNVTVPGHLPSQAYLDLLAANVISEPYLGLNDFDQRWVAESNWTYTSAPLPGLYVGHAESTNQIPLLNGYPSSSAADTPGAGASAIWLVFQGLDTFTTISLCNQTVASTNNQFRQYFFEVSDLLTSCQGDAVLSINFGSAPLIVDAIAAQPGQESGCRL